jgi:hypothetical protein
MSWIDPDGEVLREQAGEREAALHLRWTCGCAAFALSAAVAAIIARSFFFVIPLVVSCFFTWRQWTEWRRVKRSLTPETGDGEESSPEDVEGATFRCSFCGKAEEDVAQLISSPRDTGAPRAHICDQCVAMCSSILENARRGKP